MEPTTVLTITGALVGLVLAAAGAATGFRAVSRARARAAALLDEARAEAEAKSNSVLLEAQQRLLAVDEDCDRREREIEGREEALEGRVRELERQTATLARDRQRLDQRVRAAEAAEKAAQDLQTQAAEDRERARAGLERVAGLTAAQAKAEIVAEIESEARRAGARLARQIEDAARADAEREAVRVVLGAAQRIRLKEVADSTVTFIRLPSDEMKGRIIGREGRNIRALENATGIDLIVDDTPGVILISSFDPLRREIARVAIERLVEDGRIHPARIEEVVEKVRTELDTIVEEVGNQSAFSLGLSDLDPKLVRRVGSLRFHLHHGTNLLQHTMEVAWIGAHLASEFGARVEVVRRAALFHEIGRVDDSVQGHAVLASAELAGRHGETEDVVHAIQALHPDVAPLSVEALILRVANRVSENRPGARKDNLDVFVERLRRIEAIAGRYDGVLQALAVKAGKELRVIVDTARIDDAQAHQLSKDIARALERETSYPGQIRVSVVRETRAVTFAV